MYRLSPIAWLFLVAVCMAFQSDAALIGAPTTTTQGNVAVDTSGNVVVDNSGNVSSVTMPACSGSSTPCIAINGLLANATVPGNAPMTVLVSGGPGNLRDWIGTCSGTPAVGNCVYEWRYLNCSITPPSIALNSSSCLLLAPYNSGSYVTDFFANDGYSVLASETITVNGASGSGGGTACADADTGFGVSTLHLSCQASLSDDFNGSAYDATKWTPYTIGGGPVTGPTTGYLVGSGSFQEGFKGILTVPSARPLYIEWRMRITNLQAGSNWGIWLWGCSSYECYTQPGTSHVPEIDIHESVTAQQCIHTHTWVTGGFVDTPFTFCSGTGVNLADGNWHVLGLRIDPSPSPNGTLYFYQDRNLLTQWAPTTPYFLHPEQSSLGEGYHAEITYVCSGGDTGCPIVSSEQDVDYIHVYQ